MKTIIFSSGNAGKLKEVRNFFKDMKIEILSVKEIGLENFDVLEDKDSLEGNAEKKALELFDLIKKPVFSDDSGLFVDHLNGAPGVYSARYAGEHADFKDNRAKMLKELDGVPFDKRTAYFKTVICYVDENRQSYFFEGRVDGYISEVEKGDRGFGYDSIFYLPKEKRCFGEMTIEEKSANSHRVIALKEFKDFLIKNKEI